MNFFICLEFNQHNFVFFARQGNNLHFHSRVKYIPPPHLSDKEPAPMMIEDPSSSREQRLSQIIKGVLGGLEHEGFELAIVPLKADNEVAIVVVVA